MHERPHLDPGMLTVLGQNGELLRGMILSFPGRGLKCEMDTTTLYLSALQYGVRIWSGYIGKVLNFWVDRRMGLGWESGGQLCGADSYAGICIIDN